MGTASRDMRPYELFARYVKPRFQGATTRLKNAERYAMARWSELDERQGNAIQAATERHQQEQRLRQS
ncbi:hypothetical protein ACFLIM_49740 [Nonomuraea sp. M3C6]|uniref:Uncharacterized protein n=1 Tax=Nonomuraea marmarensis TaxID=3351344 RepID=A0ABW7AV02_9ACTN